MKKLLKVKSNILRTSLKILGLTGILFVMEACYGAPSGYYVERDNVYTPNDSLNVDKNKDQLNKNEN